MTDAKTVPAHIVLDKYNDLDVSHFVAALAPVLGGTIFKAPDHEDRTHWAGIVVGQDRVDVSRSWPRGKVTITIRPADLSNEELRHAQDCVREKAPEATLDPKRPLEALARDIKRRVIDPAQERHKKMRDAVAAKRDRVGELAETVERYRAAFPDLSIDCKPNEEQASIWSGKGTYIKARLYGNGSVSFEHLGSISEEKARRILAILAE